MFGVKTILPKRYNDGQKVEIKKFKSFEKKALDIAGGLSKNSISGLWKDENGKVYHDVSIQYSILVETNDQVNSLKNLIIDTGIDFCQLTMFCEVYKTDVDFLDSSRQTTKTA